MNTVKSVLIIDDDEDDLLLIEDRLSGIVAKGCTFVTCCDKYEAIRLLKERTFGLCILDYRLTGYEGIEILDAVAEAELATPIVMLTGQNDEGVAKKAIKSGAQDFVMKSVINEHVFEKSVQYAIARKELEFARVLSKRNEAENVAKDKFIAHLSHELRTPLTSILGYTSLLLEKEGTSLFQKELRIISNNGKHLLNLLNDVLDLSKIAADKFELKETPTNLEELLIEVNSLLTVSALDKGLFLEFNGSTLLPKMISIDGIRFRQVIVNLVANAIKFTDAGGVVIDIGVTHKLQNTLLTIKVSDTGIGMANHQMNSIFTAFKQVEDVANRKAGGAGLGLSITSEIVKQMGGTIKVKSTLGQGSMFTLEIPCKPISNEFIQYNFNFSYAHDSPDKAPKLQGRALVVDDVFEIRQLAGYFIKETGVQVEFASNGEQALVKVDEAESKNTPFDIIFMDLHMPVLTGEETVKALRKRKNTCHIIAMTAAINKGLQASLIKGGFDQLIAKPINKAELWRLLTTELIAHSKATANSPQKRTIEPLVHLIEDDMDSAAILQMMLEQLHYNVVHSATAKQAIKQSKTNSNIALHLVDLGLPDSQGNAFMSAFFENTISGVVVILSGNQPDPAMLSRFPITDHLVKPISKEMLMQCLQQQVKR